MSRWVYRARGAWLACLAALLSIAATPGLAIAGSSPARPSQAAGLLQDTQRAADGSLTLLPSAPAAPAIYGQFAQFGTAVSAPQQFSAPFRTMRAEYVSATPAGSAARFDLRVSADGQRWTAWEVDLTAGAVATFERPALFAQYRVTLLGSRRARPTVGQIKLQPQQSPALFSALSDEQPIAPTWTLRATRQGMVGGRTANGHIITKRDRFVSLPSWRSLSPKGTSDYMVRITYNGRSSVAPVYDVGPWNVHDNYWDEQREKFQDLPRGWPEDHAAYYDGYNKGWAEKGKVRFPTAVDVGDGVWWDDLGIKGDQATVEITFLWLGRDPMAPPPEPAPPPAEAAPAPPAESPPAEAAPAPPAEPPPAEAAPAPPAEPPPAEPSPAEAAPAPPAEPPPAEPPAEAPPPPPEPPPPPPPAPVEVLVDANAAGFRGQAIVTWYERKHDCAQGGHSLWTYTTSNPAAAENSGEWRPTLAAEASYDVYAFIPACGAKKPNTASARYLIQHRDGTHEAVIDQRAAAGSWVLLGRFPFRAGDGGFVQLHDLAGDSMRTIWFDALRWVPVT